MVICFPETLCDGAVEAEARGDSMAGPCFPQVGQVQWQQPALCTAQDQGRSIERRPGQGQARMAAGHSGMARLSHNVVRAVSGLCL